MEELVDELNDLAYRYYVLDKPAVTDTEYDRLYDELLALEGEFGPLPHSPTQRIGGEPLASFRPHRHLAPLWSLDKVRAEEDLRAWAARAEKLAGEYSARTGDALPPIRYTVEMKFDGLTINLTYRGGDLVQAATRGNGEVGEAILPQARTIRGLPLAIPFTGAMEVQGEGIMKLSAFNEYNKTAAEPLKNARNGAAGALRNLDPKVTASRRLSAFFYNVGYIEGKDLTSHVEMIEFIRSCRLPTSPFLKVCSTVDEVLEVIREAEGDRPRLDFLIDGMVVKIDDFRTREALGYTNKFPRWAVAWKFEAEEMTTVVKDIVWDAGRTGKLTPVAELEPVEIAGATVRRATLNNWDDILRKSVKIGGRVWIRRSNEVIPEIMGSVEEESVGALDPVKPERCPACGSPVAEIGANLFCPNGLACPPQAVSRLAHYASRNAMDIETFSGRTAEMFFHALGMRDVSDLYMLQRDQLVGLPGFGEKRADNLLAAIEKSKDIELNRFIFALGIPDVGDKTARDIAKKFGSFAAVRHASYDDLTAIRDIGAVVAQSIVDFFADAHTNETLDKLLASGVRPREEAKAGEVGLLSGKTFVLTGALPTLERRQAEALIEKHGGKTSGSVSARTSFVLLGTEPGSKYEKAKELGIPCISEDEFLRMIGGE
jgi:DNA ligase (NAD+)